MFDSFRVKKVGSSKNRFQTLAGLEEKAKERNVVQIKFQVPGKQLPLAVQALQVEKIAPLSTHISHAKLPKELKVSNLHKQVFESSHVHCLIGLPAAGHFIKKIETVPHYPDLFRLKTVYGYVYCGSMKKDILPEEESDPILASKQKLDSYLTGLDKIAQVLQKSYQIQSFPFDDEELMTKDDLQCLDLFDKDHTYSSRDKRFTYKIPFRQTPNMKNNYRKVLSQFHNVERQLLKDRNSQVRDTYISDMKKGFEEGIYAKCDAQESKDAMDESRTDLYFVPNFPHVRPESESTKVRIIKNFSFKVPTATGEMKSLNCFMYKGLKSTRDITDLHLKWRVHPYVFVADLKQQFHQILLSPEHQKYSSIHLFNF